MIRDDFLMRQIDLFVQALARILFSKKLNDSEQFIGQLDNLSSQFLGIDLDMLHSVSFDSIVSLFSIDGNTDLNRCFIAAEILREEFEASESEDGLSDIHFENYLKSFLLYFESLSKLEQLQNKDTFKKIENVINKMKQFQVPLSVELKMLQYYEIRKNFAAAENILHDLIEHKYPKIQKEAEDFYIRLLKKSDEELEEGNLPRDEVIEGLERIKKNSI